MDTAQLRTKVERAIGKTLPDPVWDGVDEEWREAAVRGAHGGLQDLIDEVERVLKVYRAGQENPVQPGVPSARAQRAPDQKVPLRRGEKRRAEVLAKAIAGLARLDPIVTDFRRRYLKGELLDPEDLPQLLSSPVLRVLPLNRLDQAGIPLLGALFKATTFLRPGRPGEGQVRVRGAKISWRGDSVVLRMPLTVRGDLPPLLCGRRGTHPKSVISRPDSFLDDVRILAGRLAQRYSWPEPEAAWFLFTDEPPLYDSALIDLLDPRPPWVPDGHIVLRLRPWVSVEAVARTYRICQRILLGHRMRPISEKKLNLYEFVESHKPGLAEGPNWPDLFRLWRRSSRSRRDEPPRDWRQFQRDYRRTKRLLLGPMA